MTGSICFLCKLRLEWVHAVKARALHLSKELYFNLYISRKNERGAQSGVHLIRGRSHVTGVQTRILGHEERTDYKLWDYAASCVHPHTAPVVYRPVCDVDDVLLQVRLLRAI